jgi:aspartate aminotransferase-like enzyme
VVIYPASGTGAWEAALVNTLSPGDRVLMYETGHFATLWKGLAERSAWSPEFIAGDWRSGADPAAIEAALATTGPPHQGGLRRPQRDLDRLHQPHRRGAQGDRRRRPSRRC